MTSFAGSHLKEFLYIKEEEKRTLMGLLYDGVEMGVFGDYLPIVINKN
jgi:hypothetical protein